MTEVLSLAMLPPGHTHQLEHGGKKVLLTNVEGELYAVASECSHFGLPLENAALHGHSLRCPFHHACFDVRNGKQLEAPGFAGIATYDIEVREEKIFLADQPNEPPVLATGKAQAMQPNNKTHFNYAIVGGGIAAANAVYGIREVDPEGSILLLTREDLPPYDRTHVSKALMEGGKEVTDLPVLSAEFYHNNGIVLMENTTVERLDVGEKIIKTERGAFTYDKVLLATGGKPVKLNLPGSELTGVHTVRSARDGQRIREMVAEGTEVVIIGGSFIGLEAAMSLGKQGGKITVVAPEEILFEKVFGDKVGKYVRSLHEDAGVTFRLGRKPASFAGRDKVEKVVLDNGDELNAQLVVVGVGVKPATDYLVGLAADNDGGIQVDNHLRANVEGVFATGDIARYPDRTGAARIEHWKVAAQQGRVAGRNMAGASEPYTMLPFFWSNQQGVNFRYAGHGKDFDQIVYDGEPGETAFIAFYLKNDLVQAVLGVKRDKETAVIASRMAAGENTLPKLSIA